MAIPSASWTARLLEFVLHSFACYNLAWPYFDCTWSAFRFHVLLLQVRQLYSFPSAESAPHISPVHGVLKPHNLAGEMISLVRPGQKTGFRPPERLFLCRVFVCSCPSSKFLSRPGFLYLISEVLWRPYGSRRSILPANSLQILVVSELFIISVLRIAVIFSVRFSSFFGC